MRPFHFSFFIALALCTSPAFAQNFASAKGEVRVNANFNFSQPVPANDKDNMAQTEAAARKTIYETLGNECRLLLETLASECHPESLNVNSSVQNQNFRGADTSSLTLSTNANAVFRIIIKEQTEKPQSVK